MENYEGTIGTITAGVLKAGLRPEATVQLIVGNSTQIPNYTFFAGRRRHWPRWRGRVAGQYLSTWKVPYLPPFAESERLYTPCSW
jgi:hypothetical protein